MKTLQIQLPDDIVTRFEQLAAQQGDDYESVNSDDVKGRDALFTDLLVLGLEELTAGEDDFPDED